jgi:hypothetical protein
MKHVSQFLLVSSLSLIAFSGESSLLASASSEESTSLTNISNISEVSDVSEVPARAHTQIAAPSDRANRKPAIEARVYVEDPSSPASNPSGLYYYDYKDQRPEQGQNPPLRPSTF